MRTPAPRGNYQAQESGLTLREGLAEYYRLNPGRVTPPKDLPPQSRDLFLSHDICHVIFGLDTSLADETMVDTRTVLATDVGAGAYVAYLRTDPQAKALFAELGWIRAVTATLGVLPRIARALVERSRMNRTWPWRPPASFMDRPLAELRREFRIRVI